MTGFEQIGTKHFNRESGSKVRSHTWMPGAMAVALFGLALLFRLPFCTPDLFTYDAADYLRAIRPGFLPQYLGRDSATVLDFLRHRRQDPKFQVHSWGYLYQENDGAALRHFHVPGAFYVPALLQDAGFRERGQRVGVAFVSAATVSAAFLILSSAGVPLWLAALVGLFACGSPVLILAGTNLSPHPLFTLFSIVAVYSCCRWLETFNSRWMALFAVTLAASIASLELAPILLVSVLGTAGFWCFQRLRERRPILPLRQVAQCVVLLVSSLALFWPGGWLRGGYVMSYGVFIFQGLFRSAIYFHRRNLLATISRLGSHPVAGCALAALLLVALVRAWRDRRNPTLVAFSLFAALLVVQGLGNGFNNPTYASHAVLTIAIASALSFPRREGTSTVLLWAPVVVLALLTAAGLFRMLGPSKEEFLDGSRRTAGALVALKRSYPEQSIFVVTQDVAPFLAYAPEFRFYPAESASSMLPKPWISTGPYRLLVDTYNGEPPPRTPLCFGPFAAYKFAVSCDELPGQAGEDAAAELKKQRDR